MIRLLERFKVRIANKIICDCPCRYKIEIDTISNVIDSDKSCKINLHDKLNSGKITNFKICRLKLSRTYHKNKIKAIPKNIIHRSNHIFKILTYSDKSYECYFIILFCILIIQSGRNN